MYTQLAEALERAHSDDAIRAVLIKGQPDCFTAGHDLAGFMRDSTQPPQLGSTVRFLSALSQCKKPLLAAVAGPAMGVGTTLLLHCDLVFAAPNAIFQLPFVDLGLCPEAASSLLLPNQIGYRRAAEWLLLGEAVDAETAQSVGLINAVIAANQLNQHVHAKALALAAKPAQALWLTKSLLKQAQADTVQQRMDIEGQHFIERLQSAEAQAAFAAFFKGQRA